MREEIYTLLAVILLIPIFMGCKNRENASSEIDSRRDIIIFTDCGAEIDDQWMLVHLMGMKEININAVFSSHYGGETPIDEAENSFKIIDEIIKITGNDHIPVYIGSSQRLKSKGDINHNTADIINEILRKYTTDNKAVVVISGPATDIASAINKYPSIAEKIEICATAFYSRTIGDSYNVHNDLIAWQKLLEKNIQITVSPNQVSKNSFLISVEDMQGITDSQTKIAMYLAEHYEKWISENEKIVTGITGKKDEWPIWDQILSAYLSGYCQIEETPRPVLLDNGYFNYTGSNEESSLRWIVECDSHSTWNDFKEIIQK